jgi:hypothetical protein
MSAEPGPVEPAEVPENAVIAWARAIVLGVRDTAQDVLAEGRKGASETYGRYWSRYDAKTKRRRER